MNIIRIATLATFIAASASAAIANPKVGGAAMFENKNIVENAVNSKDHTTLVAAVKAAGLVDTLMSPGPFTVLAPVNSAFAALPAGAVENLLKPENKDQLSKVLTCHVIAAKALSLTIKKMVKDDGGMHEVTTVGGCVLKLSIKGKKVLITDENGRVAKVTIADVKQSNGVIHVIALPSTSTSPIHGGRLATKSVASSTNECYKRFSEYLNHTESSIFGPTSSTTMNRPSSCSPA